MSCWSEHQPWTEPYRLAILEMDPMRVSDRIELAKKAISIRMREINGSNEHTEMRPLRDALKMLRLLEGELRNEMQRSTASQAA